MLIVEVRRKARMTALQFLFGLEFRPFEGREEIDDFWKLFPNRASVRRYAEQIILGVLENVETIDEIIRRNMVKWKLERIGIIEKVILRMAVFEAGFLKTVPPPSVISEAIELAKNFGSESTPRFVNAVLERIFTNEGWMSKNEVKKVDNDKVEEN